LRNGFKPVIYAHLGEKQQKMVYTDPGKGRGTKNVPVPPEERERFSLSEDEVIKLAEWATIIEEHYSAEAGYFKPMDMEWAKDGQTGDLFIVQARPETVVSRRDASLIRRTVLEKTGPVLAEGMAVGELIGTGKAAVIKSAKDIEQFQAGMILVTEMTDPDWVPIMKIASAIVTDSGGRTCHAAIISRELGIPCVVGTGSGSKVVQEGQEITVSCAGGAKGLVYAGILPYKEEEIHLDQLEMPAIPMFYQQSDPDRAFPDARYPHGGVGLLRIDELIRDEVKVHPRACLDYPAEDAGKIDAVSKGYPDKAAFFVTRLAQSIGRIAAAEAPRPVRALLSDATNAEMRRLIGGGLHSEMLEDVNPYLGARGVARYGELDYEEAFALELQAIAQVRGGMGLTNLSLVLPACQTAREAEKLVAILKSNGLERGSDGLEFHLLCRTPAQMLALDAFADHFDGFVLSVGDLARLTLGIDPASGEARPFFDEHHPAVLSLLETGLDMARRVKKPAGLANLSSGVPGVRAFAKFPLVKNADYVVVRSDMLPDVREAFVEALGRGN
jgi:pyruvate,water dikinase